MPRFVLLRHDCPPTLGKPSHWDLMLEQDGALLTWSLEHLPRQWRHPPPSKGGSNRARSTEVDRAQGGSPREAMKGGISTLGSECQTLPATRLPNHRLDYLDYEGPLSDDRGEVHRVDAGAYALLHDSPTALRVHLEGAHVRGEVQLTLLPNDSWQLLTAPPPPHAPK